jgi:transposase
MARKDNISILEVMHPVCCGMDVHKEKISACLITPGVFGQQQTEIREFSTFKDDLIGLKDWLIQNECPVVAMESTGIYWRPVHNILEDSVTVILVNARHVKNLPGRKTDIADSVWLAGLLRVGLLKSSFIPPRDVRQWRDLTRLRRVYAQDMADYKRRTHKLFESANIKIDSVVSDLFGATGRALMRELLKKTPIKPSDVEACAKGKLKAKIQDLCRAVEGCFTDHHRYVLSSLLGLIDTLAAQIEAFNSRLRRLMSSRQPLIDRLIKVGGISEVSSHAILAEIGDTLHQFPTPASLCCWAGLAPGNHESAGKKYSGKSPVRKHHLKTIMTEVAWAAVKVKKSYYRAKFYSLKVRIGARRAIIAIAHRILKGLYFIIKKGDSYRDLGADYLIEINREARLSRIRKQASQLGFELVPQSRAS